MLYILDQRLKAQKIPPDRALKGKPLSTPCSCLRLGAKYCIFMCVEKCFVLL